MVVAGVGGLVGTLAGISAWCMSHLSPGGSFELGIMGKLGQFRTKKARVGRVSAAKSCRQQARAEFAFRRKIRGASLLASFIWLGELAYQILQGMADGGAIREAQATKKLNNDCVSLMFVGVATFCLIYSNVRCKPSPCPCIWTF